MIDVPRQRRVTQFIQAIRTRWRRRALVQGAALSVLTLVFVASVLLLLQTAFAASPLVLLVSAILGGVAVLGVVIQYVIRPGLRNVSDQQIALYVEERIPELEDRLNSAVEVNEQGSTTLREEHGALIDRLIDDAAQQARSIPITTVVDRKRERILSYATGAALVLFLLFGYSSLDELNFSLSGVDLAVITEEQPLMTITPGDVEIEKGESQEIIVELREETERDVVLNYKLGDGAWQKEVMEKGLGEPVFLYELFDIQEPVQYFVQYAETRSDPFSISLYEFPDVEQIDLTYHYPEYTGLEPRTEEQTGDIRGVKGSTVTVSVTTTGSVEMAELVVEGTNGEQTVPLTSAEDGRFTGRIPLEDQGTYFVRLQDEQNKTNKFPEEYQIVPVEDEQPYITITDPQRDVRANAIEEVLVAVDVQDDFGVKDVRLKYSVNGEDEQAIPLKDQAEARPTEVSGEHLFFLEEYSLEPGDVISYYVEAEDYLHTESPEATDMYFIEVIPFDQQFSQVNNTGGMPGGMQSSGIVLNQQQIIAATWKLHREREEMSESEFDESHRALVQAQSNLKSNIEERINSTAFSLELRSNEDSRKVVDFLRDGVAEMEKALVELEEADLQEALTPERRALSHLLKADALNKERQVAMNRQSGGGGGNMSATEERMTELMDLELDISEDKYEMQQQRSQAQQEQQVDEALQKIRELARKQQNLANQNRQRALQGEDKKRHIERLKREQDELRQQTESLANSLRQQARENGQLSQEMEQQLDRVAENMREAERALREGDTQRAMARQQQALNELDRLQQDLRMASTDNTREMMEDLASNFDQFRDREQQLERDLERAASEARARGGMVDEEELERLREKRENVINNLKQLERQAEAIQERVQESDPELATSIRNTLRQMRRDGLEETMRDSEEALERGWLDYARRLEDEIQASIERLETQRRAFEESLPVTEEEQVARSLEDVRDLMRQIEEMRNQAESMQRQSQQGQRQDGQSQGQNQGRAARADAARMQRQLERAQEAIERLQQEMSGNPQAQQQLEALQSTLTRADHTGVLLDEETAKDFFNENVYDPLSQLELELAQQLDLIEMEKKLYGGRKGEVPAEYQDLVETYYERLAKSRE